ncbi:MAG: hypothetical protein IJR54_09005 [Oscillibacter sp.]|nr:hypothetical protein [Oscillibacter sp.]
MWDVVSFILGPIYEAVLEPVVSRFKGNRETFDKRLETLIDPERDFNAIYNETILTHFVKRRFRVYSPTDRQRNTTIRGIRSKIEETARYNLFLTGEAGMGKSIALKWLYLHARLKSPPEFLYAIDFQDCADMDAFFEAFSARLDKMEKGTAVFLDGLDELKCLHGTPEEFDRMAEYLNGRNSDKGGAHRFIISSRPEHFQFQNLSKRAGKLNASYRFYEILPLNRRETIGVCKAVKFLEKNEADALPSTRHFANKYPETVRKERKYLWSLRRYLSTVSRENSLLSMPLLCRYGYPVIREWLADPDGASGSTQAARIGKVLEYCIKWEYHDHEREHTDVSPGREKLNEYVTRVKGFLSALAGRATSDGDISRKDWEELRQQEQAREEWELNAAYCVLRESKHDNALCFTHEVFREFFLARFYASGQGDRESEKLAGLLRDNHEFAAMYAGLLITDADGLSRTVCASLLNAVKGSLSEKDRYARLANYARGALYTDFERNADDLPFTVQDFLRVFPRGSVLYMGREWNRENFGETLSDGILKILDAKDALELDKYRADKIAGEGAIRGVRLAQNTFYNLSTVFTCVDRGTEYEIFLTSKGGEVLSDEERRHLNDFKVRETIQNRKKEKRKWDELLLRTRRDYMIRFLGDQKRFWCLYWEGELYVYEDSTAMADLLNEVRKKEFSLFLNIFGNCQALNIRSIRNFRWIRTEDVCILLDGIFKGLELFEKNLEILSAVQWDVSLLKNPDFQRFSCGTFKECYFNTHAQNYVFLETLPTQSKETAVYDNILKSGKLDSRLPVSLEYFYYARYILSPETPAESPNNIYKLCTEALDEEERDLLHLHIGDEYLIMRYFLGDRFPPFGEWDNPRRFAEDTLPLCERYGHTSGAELRRRLLDDNEALTRSMERFHWIRDYVRDYIWI